MTCSVEQVYPEPSLSLHCYSESDYRELQGEDVPSDTSTTTVRRGMMYDVSVLATVSTNLPDQTIFSCFMEIPGTQYSLVKKTMFTGDNDVARARRVSAAEFIKRGELWWTFLSIESCLYFRSISYSHHNFDTVSGPLFLVIGFSSVSSSTNKDQTSLKQTKKFNNQNWQMMKWHFFAFFEVKNSEVVKRSLSHRLKWGLMNQYRMSGNIYKLSFLWIYESIMRVIPLWSIN